MPMRGGPSFTSCSMSFPQQQKTLECLPRHCNNKSEVCHHRCHYYPKHKLTQCAHQGTQWVVVGVVRHDGFHCQNTYMLLIVGVQSTMLDNFQKCLIFEPSISKYLCGRTKIRKQTQICTKTVIKSEFSTTSVALQSTPTQPHPN